MAHLRISREAERDLSLLYRQGIEMFGLSQADRYIEGLLDVLDLVAEFPEMARLRTDIEPPARVHPHQSHVIVYEIDERGDVLVVRIRHALEDWQRSEGSNDR